MADIRIKVAKDKAKLVKALKEGAGTSRIFSTYVELLVFAATLGFRQKKYLPFSEHSRKDPDPIPGEHFHSKGASQVIELMAVIHTGDPKVLQKNEVNEKLRVEIFEAYANGGLEIVEELLQGSKDNLKQILLLVSNDTKEKGYEETELDFLSII